MWYFSDHGSFYNYSIYHPMIKSGNDGQIKMNWSLFFVTSFPEQDVGGGFYVYGVPINFGTLGPRISIISTITDSSVLGRYTRFIIVVKYFIILHNVLSVIK